MVITFTPPRHHRHYGYITDCGTYYTCSYEQNVKGFKYLADAIAFMVSMGYTRKEVHV